MLLTFAKSQNGKTEISTREIDLLPYTRAISRAFHEALMQNVNVTTDAFGTQQSTTMPAVNADKAEETLIRLLSGLTQEEIDTLTEESYEELKKEVNQHTQKKTQMTT